MSKLRNILLANSETLLPGEYLQVEYIRSYYTDLTSTPYIKLEYYPIPYYLDIYVNCSMPINRAYNSVANSVCRLSRDTPWYDYGLIGLSSGYIAARTCGATATSHITAKCPYNVYNDFTTHLIRISRTGLYVDNVKYSYDGTMTYTGQMLKQLHIFRSNSVESAYNSGFYTSDTKLYLFKVVDTRTNKDVINLIPCYRKQDNVAGFYDVANRRFYTNANSSGTFILGPEI